MKAQIAQKIIGLAEYYDKTLTENQIEMFVEDLSVLTQDELNYAISRYRRNPDNSFFPLPGKLIALVHPVITEKDEAQDASHLIIAAVSKFGYTNPSPARMYMGELSWQAVQRMGGWKHLCEILTPDNEGMIKAQIRGLVEVVSKKAKLGQLETTPALPEKISSNEILKRLE